MRVAPVPPRANRRRQAWRTLPAGAGILISLLAAVPLARAAGFIVNTTTSSGFLGGYRFQLHYANGHYWAAINEEPISNLLNLYSSPDGVTWSLQGGMFSFNVSSGNQRWVTRYQGNTIVAAAYDGGGLAYFRKGTLNGDGTVTWDIPETSTGQSGAMGINAAIVNGKPFLWRATLLPASDPINFPQGTLRFGDRLSPTPIVWNDTSTTAPSLTPTTDGEIRAGAVFAIGPGPYDLIVLRATTQNPETLNSHRLVSVKYDGDTDTYDPSWFNVSLCCGLTEDDTTKTFPRTGGDLQMQVRFAAARDTSGRIHAFYVNKLNQVVHYRKDAGYNDNWTRLSTDVTGGSANTNKIAVAAASENHLYLFYSRSADGSVYYQHYDGSTWGGQQTLKTAGDALNTGSALGTMEFASDCNLGVGWQESDGDTWFEKIPGGDCPPPTAVELSSFDARGLDGSVELSWETASELDNLGFHLYRSNEEDGPYERITASLIPGLGSSPEGARYRHADTEVVNGETYFYRLEDVDTTGGTEHHGPVAATPQSGAGSSRGEGGSSEGESQSGSLITYGNPSANRFEVVRSSETEALLELVTEGFYAKPLEDGTVRLSIPGFEPTEEPFRPSIPVKRPWLEAVAGLGVRLVAIDEERVVALTGLRPSDGSEAEVVVSREGAVRLEVRRGPRSETRTTYPTKSARVLGTGYQGEVKKAQVELAPLRWDGDRLLLTRRLVIQLRFGGRARRESSLGGARGRLYRGPASQGTRNVVARLATRERGLHLVRYEEIFRARAGPTRSLRLSRLGEPVAFHVEPDSRPFGPGSRLYFLGRGPEANPYGDEAVYELELGIDGESMTVANASPLGEPTSSYRHRLVREVNRYYQAALLTAEDLWFWDVLMAPVKKSYAFEVRGLASSGEAGRLSVRLHGASDFGAHPDHHVRVYLNGALLGEASWDGKNSRKVEVEIPPDRIHEGENVLELENAGDTGAQYSMVFLDRYEVEYPRSLEAQGGYLEGRWSAAGVAAVSGVGSTGYVLDVTEDQEPIWLRGVKSAPDSVLRFRAEAGREYLVVGAQHLSRPQVRVPARSHLKSPNNGADYLIVGPRVFLDEAQPLLELRRSQGLRVKSVSVEQVYEEFGFGEGRPEALREFLAYAYHRWQPPAVRYALLLGDGTYDFKNYLATGVQNQVPPLLVKTSYLWTASDPTLAAVNGDDLLPDVAIGRLPAASEDETRVMVEKILNYESELGRLSNALVLVADNPDAAGDFVAHAEAIASGALAGRDVQKLYLSERGPYIRSAITAAFDEGATLVSYIGHGGIQIWATENIFNTADVGALGPQSQQPLFLTMNCLNGYFHFPYFNSLGEEVLKAEGRGAIAAFSPTGLSLDGPAHVLHEAVLNEVFNGAHERLGDAVLATQSAYAETGIFPDLLLIYHLLGDPALRIR